MKKSFTQNSASSYQSGKKALEALGISYIEKNKVLYVNGDIDLAGKDLENLPDLSCVVVKGNFDCSRNKLKNLEGAPKTVGGNFYCHLNNLSTLKGAPKSVGASFGCCFNKLRNLKDGPETVGEGFYCNENQFMESLEGAPEFIPGDFDCRFNKLPTLKGGPQAVKGAFLCKGNSLKNLAYAPQTFRELRGDFDDDYFTSYETIHESLRFSPDQIEELKKEKEQIEACRREEVLKKATTLPKGIKLYQPLKVTKRKR